MTIQRCAQAQIRLLLSDLNSNPRPPNILFLSSEQFTTMIPTTTTTTATGNAATISTIGSTHSLPDLWGAYPIMLSRMLSTSTQRGPASPSPSLVMDVWGTVRPSHPLQQHPLAMAPGECRQLQSRGGPSVHQPRGWQHHCRAWSLHPTHLTTGPWMTLASATRLMSCG